MNFIFKEIICISNVKSVNSTSVINFNGDIGTNELSIIISVKTGTQFPSDISWTI